ncbi:MAG: hypothetical protein PHP86_09195 [Nevskiales bacterium]|nr:hypothetical protein [Nevskiales bacterium]
MKRRAVAILFGGLALAVLAGLWWRLSPDSAATATTTDLRQFTLDTTAEPQTLLATQGDTIELTVVSPGDDELHLHGYDLSLRLHGGTPARLRFVARHAGRFELELHDRHTELGALEIRPR